MTLTVYAEVRDVTLWWSTPAVGGVVGRHDRFRLMASLSVRT